MIYFILNSGINAQYINCGKIFLRAVAMVVLQQRQTGGHLKDVVSSSLASCGISLQQIFSITTDGGSNMLKCVDLMIEDQELERNDPYILNASIEQVVSGVTYEDSLLAEFESKIFYEDDAVVLRGVRCAAHSLQLGVEDAIRCPTNSYVVDILNRVRTLVKYLRTANIIVLLNAHKLNKAILDNETRWHSKLDMLERILELKTFCTGMENTYAKLFLCESDWSSISSIVSALKPPKLATKILQAEQLTLGSFLTLLPS